ncbi:4Fe-4S dicluster domain-containing protein [soil metagenome]
MDQGSATVLAKDGLDALIGALAAGGYRVCAPTVRDGAIMYDDIAGVADLPEGWTDEQDGGRYRLKRRDDDALFGYVVGPESWKKYLHPPRQKLWRAERNGADIAIAAEADPEQRFAFFGVRACELAAIAVQDRVFLEGKYVDPHYRARREGVFIVAVNCGEAHSTCFCVSMNTGPKADAGFDLSLTEIVRDGVRCYLVEVGSDDGRAMLAALPQRAADAADQVAADAAVANAVATMGRRMETGGIRDLLLANLEHPRWEDVAGRCLTCGNCTMVCPTCFCTSTEDSSDLAGTVAERSQRWDSCFTMDFSYIHGGSVRASPKSRYRQWMTHKLATWWDQFDSSGCVGCGRCITWCPVGIDITEEAAAIRAQPAETAA